MVKRILVVLSGTPYTQAAIRHAVELAQRHDARVTGIVIFDKDADHRGPGVIERASDSEQVIPLGNDVVRERVDANVAEFEKAAQQAGIEHRVIRREGEPVQALCAEWRYQDLTVVGLRGLFEYGVVAEPKEAISRLIRSGMHPIFAVSKAYVAIRRVLVAHSGSLESAATMKSLIQLRLWPEAVMQLVYFTDGDEPKAAYQALLADSIAYCKDWNVKLEAQARIGGARDHLLSYAGEQKVDLIVLGDSAKSLLTRRLLGDTALHVIRRADRPLFISH